MQTELNALPERYLKLYYMPPAGHFTIFDHFLDRNKCNKLYNMLIYIYIKREREREREREKKKIESAKHHRWCESVFFLPITLF
jgi:hypothetical protein